MATSKDASTARSPGTRDFTFMSYGCVYFKYNSGAPPTLHMHVNAYIGDMLN